MAGALVATLMVGALALGYAVFHHTGGNSAGQSSAGQSSARGSSAGRGGAAGTRPLPPAAIRHNAAAWVKAQVGSAAVVSCDPAMCQALESRGVPTGQMLVLKPGVASPLGSAVIVATPFSGSRSGAGSAPGTLPRCSPASALAASRFRSGPSPRTEWLPICPWPKQIWRSGSRPVANLRRTPGS